MAAKAKTGETPPPTPDAAEQLRAFGSTKRELLLLLKKDGEADLEGLARTLSISKMAVYKHVKELEHTGLVERFSKRTGVGRPRLGLRLAPGASAVFPKAYASVTCAVLEFVEQKMGREAVEAALKSRHKTILPTYQRHVRGDDLETRVRELADLRDREGYMAEVRGAPGGRFELLEYNCPILAIADKYWEACKVENELFRKVLRADVETTHRVVAGDHVCRFLIKPRAEVEV